MRRKIVTLGYYKKLNFTNGESVMVDLKETLCNDTRKIVQPLRAIEYYKTYQIELNTIKDINGTSYV